MRVPCPGRCALCTVQGSCNCQNNASWSWMYSGTTVFQVFTLKRAYVSPRTVSTKKRADMRKSSLCHMAHGLLGLIRTLLGSLSASGPRTDWLERVTNKQPSCRARVVVVTTVSSELAASIFRVEVQPYRWREQGPSNWSVLLTKSPGDHIKKNGMGGACGMCGGEEKCVEGYGGETKGKEVTRKTQA